MRTDDLLDALAAQPPRVDRRAVALRFAAKLALAPLAALLLVAALPGIDANWRSAAGLPMFWVKFAVPAAVVAGAWWLVRLLGVPGARFGRSAFAALAPLAGIGAAGWLVLWQAPAGGRLPLLLGNAWAECPWEIALLAVPAFGLAVWALRELAPTRLRLAGAAAGLFAGAAGAFGHAFHCPELAAPFLGTWHVAGMLLPALAGALAGPRLLRW